MVDAEEVKRESGKQILTSRDTTDKSSNKIEVSDVDEGRALKTQRDTKAAAE